MGFCQLAEVPGGSHKIQLQGKGSNFKLTYATSQVIVIPSDRIQLKTTTGDWTMTIKRGSQLTKLLKTRVVVTEDSVLVLAATFETASKCTTNWEYIQISLNGNLLNGHLGSFHLNWGRTIHYPGNLLRIKKVKVGSYRIALAGNLMKKASCDFSVTRAVMQVGVIPNSY